MEIPALKWDVMGCIFHQPRQWEGMGCNPSAVNPFLPIHQKWDSPRLIPFPFQPIPQEMGRGGHFGPLHQIGVEWTVYEHPRVPTSTRPTVPQLFPTVPTVKWKVRHAALMAANSAPQTPFSSHPRHSTQVLMSAPSEGGCATPASNGWAPFRPAPAPSSCQTFNNISLCD